MGSRIFLFNISINVYIIYKRDDNEMKKCLSEMRLLLAYIFWEFTFSIRITDKTGNALIFNGNYYSVHYIFSIYQGQVLVIPILCEYFTKQKYRMERGQAHIKTGWGHVNICTQYIYPLGALSCILLLIYIPGVL